MNSEDDSQIELVIELYPVGPPWKDVTRPLREQVRVFGPAIKDPSEWEEV